MIYRIRRMEKADLYQVTEIDREAFPTQWPPANYRQELGNRLAHYIVVCDDTKTAEAPVTKPQNIFNSWLRPWLKRGHSTDDAASTEEYIVGFSGIWLMADEAHVTNIAVRQQYQRRGIGELLLIATIDMAKELNASIMTLEVRASNIAAQNLYSKYSFLQVGIRRGYYLDNKEDGIIMTTESIASDSFRAQLEQLRKDLAKRLG